MGRALHEKSSVEQIRKRFDADVDRFSQLETGQQAAMDAPVILETIARVAATQLKKGDQLLDLGCGAGNFTLRVLGKVSPLDCILVDLSRPMLERAEARVRVANSGHIQCIQADMRELSFPHESLHCILAGQSLHHLRGDAEWETMFGKLNRWLRPGGTLFVADLIAYDDPDIQGVMSVRYGEYLEQLGGAEYREKVFAYTEQEDSPRSTRYQLKLMERSGFTACDLLHKNALFAAYYGRK